MLTGGSAAESPERIVSHAVPCGGRPGRVSPGGSEEGNPRARHHPRDSRFNCMPMPANGQAMLTRSLYYLHAPACSGGACGWRGMIEEIRRADAIPVRLT